MLPYIAEFLGTMILIILGDGVVANVNLNKSGMKGAGAVQITFAGALQFCFRHLFSERLQELPLIRHLRSHLQWTEVLHGRWFLDISSPRSQEHS